MNNISTALAGLALGCVATITCQDVLSPAVIRIMGATPEPAIFASTDALGGGRFIVRDQNGDTILHAETGIVEIPAMQQRFADLERRIRSLEAAKSQKPTTTPAPAPSQSPPRPTTQPAPPNLADSFEATYQGMQPHPTLRVGRVHLFKVRNTSSQTARLIDTTAILLDHEGDTITTAACHLRQADIPDENDPTSSAPIPSGDYVFLWAHLNDRVSRITPTSYRLEFKDGSTLTVRR